MFAGYLAFTTVWQAIERGSVLEDVQTLSEKYAAFARQSRNEAVHGTIRLEQQFVASLRGRTSEGAQRWATRRPTTKPASRPSSRRTSAAVSSSITSSS